MKMHPNPHNIDPQPGDWVEGRNFSCRVVERMSKYTILGDDGKITPLSLLVSCSTPTGRTKKEPVPLEPKFPF